MSKTAESIALLDEIRDLMNIKGENPFKVRAFEKATKVLEGQKDLEARAKAGTLTELAGIGKGISEVLTEFLLEGKSTVRDELKSSLPVGLAEFASISGIGPKKAITIIKELKIHTLGELEYACRENRLLHLKGFGEKIQAKILDSIQFKKQNEGRYRIDEALVKAEEIKATLQKKFKLTPEQVEPVGELRRCMEVINEWSFLLDGVNEKSLAADTMDIEKKHELRPGSLKLVSTPKSNKGWKMLEATGSSEWVKQMKEFAHVSQNAKAESEEDVFEQAGLFFVPPECRESENTSAFFGMKNPAPIHLIDDASIQGVFHMHTTRSDGSASLEEMVQEAARLGLRYIGVSDHSQSAFYAQGLKPDDLKEQAEEREKIQKKYPSVKIFWGIESDILQDGSLDYPEKVLKNFDFVIASIHSRFQMEKKEMTERIITAIRNPYTRFIGHLTGRLLLGRKPYELDIDRIIDEAAQHNVAIELNAHPSRLDIDWRHGTKLRETKTWVSINPDAHEIAGLSDTRYGVMMARKALLPKNQIINTKTPKEVEAWLQRK